MKTKKRKQSTEPAEKPKGLNAKGAELLRLVKALGGAAKFLNDAATSYDDVAGKRDEQAQLQGYATTVADVVQGLGEFRAGLDSQYAMGDTETRKWLREPWTTFQ